MRGLPILPGWLLASSGATALSRAEDGPALAPGLFASSSDAMALALGVAFGILALAGLQALQAWRKRCRANRQTSGTDLARRLLEREETERKRVAQAIHDGLGHHLLELKQAAAQARGHPAADAALVAQLGLIEELASTSLETARDLAYRLRPFELDQLGLKAAIESLLASACQGTDLRVFKDLESLPADFTPGQQAHLFRLVQDAVLNVTRHAHAANLLLEINRKDDRLTIQIDDDGVGFDAAAAQRRPNGGLGLARMAEHAGALGGELQLTSRPGHGTQVRVVIPGWQA